VRLQLRVEAERGREPHGQPRGAGGMIDGLAHAQVADKGECLDGIKNLNLGVGGMSGWDGHRLLRMGNGARRTARPALCRGHLTL
jgi:hypothetical protein